jgi:DNA-binding response OmpR family regulator
MPHAKILVVDDDPALRETLRAILQQNGFEVTMAANVSDALRLIAAERFDVLISDLNIGEPGDGFTVVSAMRRTQPRCLNYILTGYPEFETALTAIRDQVDDYLTKPTDVNYLLESIAARLGKPRTEKRRQRVRPMAALLEARRHELLRRTVATMRRSAELRQLPLDDEQRSSHLAPLLDACIAQMRSPSAQAIAQGIAAASVYGRERRHQGYSVPMLLEDFRIMSDAVHDLVRQNVLEVELSNLIPELKRFGDILNGQMQEAVKTFLSVFHLGGGPKKGPTTEPPPKTEDPSASAA